MHVEIVLGWWLLPTAVSFLAFGWYAVWEARQPPTSGYGAIGQGLGGLIVLLCAVFVSALAWIAYLTVALWTK
jgi:hypothetical protein